MAQLTWRTLVFLANLVVVLIMVALMVSSEARDVVRTAVGLHVRPQHHDCTYPQPPPPCH